MNKFPAHNLSDFPTSNTTIPPRTIPNTDPIEEEYYEEDPGIYFGLSVKAWLVIGAVALGLWFFSRKAKAA